MDAVVNNKVIVFGGDNYCTLGLARQLGKSGLDVFYLITCGKQSCATKSKYCKKVKFVASIQEGVSFLMENYTGEQYKPIVIASGDLEAEALDQNKVALEQYLIIPGTAEQGLLTKVDDKNYMVQIADEIGFLVPKSIQLMKNSLDCEVEFPCVIKPSKYTVGVKKEFKAKLCETLEELRETLKYVRNDSVFIVQQYIPKEKDLLIYGCRMFDGEVRIAGSFYRDRWVSEGSDASHGYIKKGLSGLVRFEQLKTMLEKIGYYGIFSFEFGVCDGKAYFFEINLRNDGTSQDFYQLGANIPLAWVYNCAGLDYSLVQTQVQEEGWYMDEIYDFLNVIRGVVSRKQWKQDKIAAKAFRYYDQEDKSPWKYQHVRRLYFWVKRLIIDKYRPIIVRCIDRIELNKK